VCLLLRSTSLRRACEHFNVTIKLPCNFVSSCSQGELQIETALGGGQEFKHCDKCGRGRVPSVPLRMRQTHFFKQLAFPFLFLFHPLSSFLFGFHCPLLSLFLCCFHSSNPPLFKLLPVTPSADGWVPVCADFGAPCSSCNMN
jgi:hypothetical protein